jgi:putative PEP-CTERM system histidine kinase
MLFIALSYGSAAVAYGLLTAVLLFRRESAQQGRRVLVAVGGTALWGASIAGALTLAELPESAVILVADAARAVVWIIALLAAGGPPTARNIKGFVLAATLGLAGIVVLTVLGVVPASTADLAMLALSTLGCLTVEQIFRNSTVDEKRVLKPFLWALGCMFVYDVFVFADAALFDAVDAVLWAPRGFAAAIAVPFFVLAAKRHPDWAETLFVSREFAFYSATLIAVGFYLLAVGAGAFVIRQVGGQWGVSIQISYLVAALAMLASILSSARLRAQLRVFINKHFYRNRYDYREEWLRLIRTLSDLRQDLPLDQRSIKALAEIVGSSGGQLWLDREGRSIYEPFSSWQSEFPQREIASRPLLGFLREHQWVIDSSEYERDPERYQHVFRDDPAALPGDSLVVPLMHQEHLLGVIRLNRPPRLRELNYEDHDLLKTAGRQVAAFLANDLARERLGETQQFEAFNKLSTFMMHDIKNLLAQQALLVNNAKKFRDRPEFVDDVIRTVDSGVQRMRRLLRQLEQGTQASQQQRVDLHKLILRAVSTQSEQGGVACSLEGDNAPCWVLANSDELSSVIMHVIQNAQDASAEGSRVFIRVAPIEGDRIRIEVSDHGQGMSQEFISRKLFKPFETTKGSSGMGIGAYQAREVIRGLGGDLTVTSEVGKGTVVSIVLPLERRSAA